MTTQEVLDTYALFSGYFVRTNNVCKATFTAYTSWRPIGITEGDKSLVPTELIDRMEADGHGIRLEMLDKPDFIYFPNALSAAEALLPYLKDA